MATRAEGPAAEAMRKGGARLAEQGPEAFARERAPQLLSPGADAALIEEVAQIMAEATRLPGYEYAAAAIADMDRKCHCAQRHRPKPSQPCYWLSHRMITSIPMRSS